MSKSERQDKRLYERFKSECALLLVDAHGKEWASSAVDVSRNGISFVVPQELKILGECIMVKIPQCGGQKFIQMMAKLRSQRSVAGQLIHGVMMPIQMELPAGVVAASISD